MIKKNKWQSACYKRYRRRSYQRHLSYTVRKNIIARKSSGKDLLLPPLYLYKNNSTLITSVALIQALFTSNK